MESRRYIINPALETTALDELTVNVISPLDRFTVRDESGLTTALFRAAAQELDVDAFIEQHSTQHLAFAIEAAVSAMAEKEILLPADDCKPLDSFFRMLEYGRSRSGPPLGELPKFDQPEKWLIAVAGTGSLADKFKTSLRALGFSVETFDAGKIGDDRRPNLVVACADYEDFRSFRLINRATIAARLPAYYISIDRQIVRAGPLVIPHQTACMECFFHRVASTRRYPAEFIARAEEGNLLSTLQPSRIALDTAATAIDRILFFATGMATDLHLTPVREHDIMRGTSRTSNLLRLPRCPVCSAVAKRPAVQIYSEVVAQNRG